MAKRKAKAKAQAGDMREFVAWLDAYLAKICARYPAIHSVCIWNEDLQKLRVLYVPGVVSCTDMPFVAIDSQEQLDAMLEMARKAGAAYQQALAKGRKLRLGQCDTEAEARRVEIRKLHRRGWPKKRIARQVGVTDSYVRRVLKNFGTE